LNLDFKKFQTCFVEKNGFGLKILSTYLDLKWIWVEPLKIQSMITTIVNEWEWFLGCFHVCFISWKVFGIAFERGLKYGGRVEFVET